MEIKRCIKCGGEPERIKLWETKRADCFYRCRGCGRETKVYASNQGALAAWNDGKLTKTDADWADILREFAAEGRPHKKLFLEAAERIEELSGDIAELQDIIGMRDKREWYSKFVKEVYQKQKGNELSHPDFDYIYKVYFDMAADNEKWREMWAENQEKWEKAYEALEAENERLKRICESYALLYGTVRDKDAVLKEARALGVRKMRTLIKERCIAGGIYPAFVARVVDEAAEEVLMEVPK